MEGKELTPTDFEHVVRHDMNKSQFGVGVAQNPKGPELLVFEYSPYVFAAVRQTLGISREAYMRSMGPESMLGNLLLGYLDSMQQLGSEGKSGSLFYLTHDNKYFVKTVRKREFDLIRKCLRTYHEHLSEHPQSLLYRITGLYSIEHQLDGNRVENYLIVMMNVFSQSQPSATYDLKGSTHGRTSFKSGKQVSSVLKDLDWRQQNFKFELPADQVERIVDNLRSAAKFLATLNLIDYSLIVGVTRVQKLKSSKTKELPLHEAPFEYDSEKSPWNFISRCGKIKYTIAIVDVWTEFTLKKKLEYYFKLLAFGKGVSCVPPVKYSERFLDFLKAQFI